MKGYGLDYLKYGMKVADNGLNPFRDLIVPLCVILTQFTSLGRLEQLLFTGNFLIGALKHPQSVLVISTSLWTLPWGNSSNFCY